MQRKLFPEAEKMLKQNTRRRGWRKVVRAMACIVVFCTTYALILPAITLEKDTVCGIEEHTHSEECYQQVTVTEQPVLSCGYPHTHTEDCYALEQGALLCQVPEEPGHTHSESCYVLAEAPVCGMEEIEGHAHTDTCVEKTLTCSLSTEEVHVHEDGCYEPSLVCGQEEAEAYTYEETYEEQVLICENTEEGHVHDDTCFQTQTTVETVTVEGHTHGEECYEDALVCTLSTEAHVHGDECYAVNYLCGLEEIEGHTHSMTCYDPVLTCQVEESEGHAHSAECYEQVSTLVCGLTEDEAHVHEDACYTLEEVPLETQPLTCTLEEDETHTHSAMCYGTWNLVCEKEEHVHTDECRGLSEEEQAQVDAVIAMIDELPTYDEVAEKMDAFYESGDTEAEEEYFTWIGQTGLRAYNAYQELTEEQQGYVTNIDRLMDLSSIWSVATLVETTTTGGITAYARDTINCTNTSGEIRPILVYGYVLNHFGENATDPNTLWMAININESVTGRLYVDYISGYAPLANFMGWEPQYEDRDGDDIKEGFVLLIPVDYAINKNIIGYVSVGDMVTVQVNASNTSTDSNYTEYYHRSQYHTGAGLWDIFFYSAEKEEKDNSSELTIVQGANTYDLIEVNLFDYNSAINTKYNENSKYLGFQQDYGTKSIDKTDGDDFGSLSFNFGNNITEDLDAGRTDITSENATGVINRITKIDDSKLADVPISGAVEKLLSGRYPVIADFGASLDRYFHKGYENEGVVQMNTDNISGLFLYNEETGAYTFDSRENHAQFNAATNKFVLYDQIFSPNFIMYPFGNFMPLNDIVHDTVRASECERPYLLEIANSARWKSENGYRSDYATLANVLYRYIDEMDTLYEGIATRSWTAGNMVQQYFGKAYPNDPNETPTNLNNLLPQIYTLDYDTPSNFYFGMNMRMNLMQPKGGMTGKNNAYPMVFEFAGDDDVWVFIDGVLFLELSGIHRHVGGEIDFVNGLVHYYAFDSYVDGKIKTTPYKTETFAQILEAAGKSTDVLNENGTFKDYTSHSFDFFYTERGSGSSVCRMNFNFPLLKQNTISVAKELTSTTNVEMVGNPDFTFQIMKASNDQPFFGAGVPYVIYDNATNVQIGTGTTEEYGVFKIKAGQRAEFTGIDENSGEYYIREILDSKFMGQYDSFYVDGTVTTNIHTGILGKYEGVVSPPKDISNGSMVFTYNNHVDASKLSYLTITKIVEGVSAEEAKKLEFDMMVELNGILYATKDESEDFDERYAASWVPIPVGTKYTLYDTAAFIASNGKDKVKIADRPDRVVTTEGIVTVPGGATAEIDYMIPGTTYRVYETSGSAEGYTVGYGEFWGGDWITAYDDRVEGTIPVYNETNLATAHVCMTVTNALPSTKVEFSVYKQMINGALDDNPHTVNFTAKCITATAKDGSSVDVLLGTGTQARVTIGDNQWNEAKFLIGYDYYKQFDGHVAANNWPVRLIYEIEEVPSDDMEYTHDDTKYYVAVDINLTKVLGSWKFTATLVTPVPVYADNTVPESGYATFQNYLLGDLSLEKQVEGGTVSQENGSFDFTVQIDINDTTALPNWTVQVIKNGGAAETQTTSAEGKLNLKGIKHGDRVQIRGIPLGCVWRIVETNADGYIVSWTKNGESGNSNVAIGEILAGGMEVVFTNTSTYALPETGGAGTTPYTMAGLVLICFSMAYLMYRSKARRREEFESP